MTFDAILKSTFSNAIPQTPNFEWHGTVFILYLYYKIRGMGKKKKNKTKENLLINWSMIRRITIKTYK